MNTLIAIAGIVVAVAAGAHMPTLRWLARRARGIICRRSRCLCFVNNASSVRRAGTRARRRADSGRLVGRALHGIYGARVQHLPPSCPITSLREALRPRDLRVDAVGIR